VCNLIYRFITYYAVHSRRLPRRLLLPLQQGRGSCDAAAILNSDEDHPAPASTGTKRRSDTCRVAQFRPLTPRPSPRPTSYTPFRPRSSFLPYSSLHTVSCAHCNYHTGVTKPSLTTKKRSYTCRVAQFRPLAPRPYPPSTPYTPFRPRSLFLPYSSFHTVSCAHCNYPSPCAQWHHHMVIFT